MFNNLSVHLCGNVKLTGDKFIHTTSYARQNKSSNTGFPNRVARQDQSCKLPALNLMP